MHKHICEIFPYQKSQRAQFNEQNVAKNVRQFRQLTALESGILLRHLQRTASWPLRMADRMLQFPDNTECKKYLFHVELLDIITTDSTPFLRLYAKDSDTMNRFYQPELSRSKPSGHYMYHQFNIHKFYVQPTHCIYVFCTDLRTKSDCFPIQH